MFTEKLSSVINVLFAGQCGGGGMGEIFNPQNICEAAKLSKTTGWRTLWLSSFDWGGPLILAFPMEQGANPVISLTLLSTTDKVETHLGSSSGL